MTFKQDLEFLISQSIKSHFPDITDVYLERPKQADHGDFASNIALRMAKLFKKSPVKIAEEISNAISTDLEAVCVVTPLNGFLNFKCNDQFLLKYANQNVSFNSKNKRILLEYVSANPTGPLHIGHGRWAAMGDVIYRLLTTVGYSVDREFYINDAGVQITNLRNSVNAVKNGDSVPDDGYQGAYIHDLAKLDHDPKDLLLAQQKETLSAMGVEFDRWFSELTLHSDSSINDGLNRLKDCEMAYESDGALWFKSTEFGDDKDRVLIKSDGQYTYFAVDIAYHYDKIQREYDKLINIWGADHHGYVPRVQSVVSVLKSDAPNDYLTVILGQLVSLFRDGQPVRMSKRTGEMIILDEVVEEIGADATRFFLIEKSADTSIDFDLEIAKKSSNENPVYYVQYAHARLCRLSEQFEDELPSIDWSLETLDLYERKLVLHLARLKDSIETAAAQYAPYQMAQYATECARLFHSFYEHCPLLKADTQTQIKRRHLLSMCRTHLAFVLSLMGITAPEKM